MQDIYTGAIITNSDKRLSPPFDREHPDRHFAGCFRLPHSQKQAFVKHDVGPVIMFVCTLIVSK